MPDRAANDEPISQARRRTRIGLMACRPSSAGSSTTACIDRPSFVRLKNRYSAATATRTKTVTMIWSIRTLTPGSATMSVGR